MCTYIVGKRVDVVEFKCSSFCKLRIFNEGHNFDKSTGMVISSNRFGMTLIASPNQLCLISMKHLYQLVGDFGMQKDTITNFLRREIELDYSPNFLDISCDENYIAVAGISNTKVVISIYNIESLILQSYVSPLMLIELEAIQNSYVIDMSWNPGVQNSLACCLSDGSLHIIDLKDGGTYSVVSLPPQSSTLCLSWSPKGKQIIIGSSNGSLIQYKPELKAVKQYLPPTDINANVKPIKVKWISNFQFAVVYEFVDNINNQPILYILNTPKNGPIEFINFEQYVVMNSDEYRLNQYYTIFQQNWNLMFVASSNCTEIGVMGINNENQWQCWVLETRPELPFSLDRQMYPLGMSLDLSSQRRIKQISKSNEEIYLDPMPVLCVLSSDGILFMYHIENKLTGYTNICKPSSELSDNILTQLFTTYSKINNIQENEQEVVNEVIEQVDEINVIDEKAKGDHNESILANYLETTTSSHVEQSQISEISKVSVVKPNIPVVSTAETSPIQNIHNLSNVSDRNTSTDEVINQVMLNEVLEDVQIFQSELNDVLKLSISTSKLKIGDEKDKELLVKKWTSLNSFFKELNETNRSQRAESKTLQKAVLDSIAWIEDSKSRLFFLKNPKYKCLLRNDNDEPFTKTIFENIERMLYYIETQLTHVDDQLKARYDIYNPNKKELKIPCLETIYKSLVVNTNIVHKLKEKINCLCNIVEDVKYKSFKKLSLAPVVVQNSCRLNESRDVGLSKLSEQLLKITLDKDGISAINSYNVAKKYSVLSANQRALSDSKVNKLQEWLKDFKTRHTKITSSNYANIDLSRHVCSTPLKSKIQNIDLPSIITKENLSSTLNTNYNTNEHNIEETKLQLTSKADLMQIKKPLFIPTTQQTNGIITSPTTPITTTFSAESKLLQTDKPFWNSVDNTSTPKPVLSNNSDTFDYKVFIKEPVKNETVISSCTSITSIFGSNIISTVTSNIDPVDFSFKSSMAKPLNFGDALNKVTTKATLNDISGTTELKEKIPFNFSNVSIVKSETPKSNTSITATFNFTDSIKNKMDNPKEMPLTTFNFETTKSLTKPLESSSMFSGFNAEDKSKNSLLTTFNFNSKPETSFSTFSFAVSKDTLKTTASDTKSNFTSTSTAMASSFNFSLPPVVSEPICSTVPSAFGSVKTVPVTVPSAITSNTVTETTSRISESPTPIISEPVTPESETIPTTPVTTVNTPIFEIPLTSSSIFNTPINSTSTTSIFGNSISTTSQSSIFNTPINTTNTSIFNTSTNMNNASTIFNSSINTTDTSSIFNTSTSTPLVFGTNTNTTSAPSVFGTSTNATTSSSIFGTPTNPTTSSTIFGSSVTTSSIFGNPIKTSTSIFGTSSITTVSSIFGSATTTNTTSGFGSPTQTTTVFGSPITTSSSIFGNPTNPASSNSIFGSVSTTSSIFGTPATTSTSSIFGTPSTTSASSGLFGSVAAAANQPSSFGQTSLGFNSPGSAFGNMSLFGQQACSPSQPVNSFTPPANPFAIAKTPSTTPSLFSSQKTVFGQPTASTTNTGFGIGNSGFGTTGTSGFGSSPMSGQSSNLGFGSPPMFGSMGTAYDMSKTSGFGQTPVFGGAATFGSTTPSQYTFGQNSNSAESGNFGFGSATQQQSTAFASIAAQNNSPSFGNIAQNQNTGFASPSTTGFGQQQQTSPFKPQGATFGGSSFNSWR